jgi:hypothetical protein
MQNMEQYGRNGDTTMAHLTPGETVVPQQVLRQNPQVARGLGRAFQDAGADPNRYVVGSGQNSINPMTGEPEFFWKELFAVGKNLLSNPSVQGALGNAALRKIQGKDVGLRDLLLGGAIGGGLGAVTGRGTGVPFLDNMMSGADADTGNLLTQGLNAGENIQIGGAPGRRGAVEGAVDFSKGFGNLGSGYKDGLLGYGEFLGLDPNEGLGKLLNSKIGEGLATGLGSVLYDSVFGKDEEPDSGDLANERFNRGSGQAPVKFRPRENRDRDEDYLLMRNEGGPAYFPRRNGGIMPSEGSGTKDDVPAMLTAGEFVMTRDAVKGAGGGDLNDGINKMYGMMNNLERKVG